MLSSLHYLSQELCGSSKMFSVGWMSFFVFAAGPGDDLTVFVDGVPYAWGLTVTKS